MTINMTAITLKTTTREKKFPLLLVFLFLFLADSLCRRYRQIGDGWKRGVPAGLAI